MTTERAGPIIKWVGGKSKLLDRILPVLPEKIETYYEPFVGGGAVFFALASAGRFKRAVLSDQNAELVELYRVVRDDVRGLLEALSVHAPKAGSEDYYYRMRAKDPTALCSVERAARLLYLNRTCYNGLYRVNKKGHFNVPFGRYKNPKVMHAEALYSASRILKDVEIHHRNYDWVLKQAQPEDAVYFDPPYVPLSATASFTAYAKSAFGEEQQKRLADVFRELAERGVSAALSNSDCKQTRALYRGLDLKRVFASRAVNSDASKRGPVAEVLVYHQAPLGRSVRKGPHRSSRPAARKAAG